MADKFDKDKPVYACLKWKKGDSSSSYIPVHATTLAKFVYGGASYAAWIGVGDGAFSYPSETNPSNGDDGYNVRSDKIYKVLKNSNDLLPDVSIFTNDSSKWKFTGAKVTFNQVKSFDVNIVTRHMDDVTHPITDIKIEFSSNGMTYETVTESTIKIKNDGSSNIFNFGTDVEVAAIGLASFNPDRTKSAKYSLNDIGDTLDISIKYYKIAIEYIQEGKPSDVLSDVKEYRTRNEGTYEIPDGSTWTSLGYRVKEWYADASLTVFSKNSGDVVNCDGNAKYYGKWAPMVTTARIDTSIGIKTGTITWGSTSLSITETTRDNHKALGYYWENGIGKSIRVFYSDGKAVPSVSGWTDSDSKWISQSSDIGMWIEWAKITKITLNSNYTGGSTEGPYNFTQWENLPSMTGFSREGYRLLGYYDSDGVKVLNADLSMTTESTKYYEGGVWSYKTDDSKTLYAHWQETYKVTVTNGSASAGKAQYAIDGGVAADIPSGDIIVADVGKKVTLSAVPNPNYRLREWSVGGVSDTNATKEFTTVAAVTVNWQETRAMTINVTGSGTVEYNNNAVSGTVAVDKGSSPMFTFVSAFGYKVRDVVIDGISVGNMASYTFNNVSAEHTISVSFMVEAFYTITATASKGGSISPGGEILVEKGGSQTFTFTPESGYKIRDVVIDGISAGSMTQYTFAGVISDHTVSVIFTLPGVMVTLMTASGGKVTGGGEYPIGATVTLYADPNEGYEFVSWSDGGAQIHSFVVNSEMTVTAVFREIVGDYVTVHVDQSGGGSYHGNTLVKRGTSATIYMVPADGYRIGHLRVDGVAHSETSILVLGNLMKDITVTVVFVKLAGAGSNVNVDGTITTDSESVDGIWKEKYTLTSRPDGRTESEFKIYSEVLDVWSRYNDDTVTKRFIAGGDKLVMPTADSDKYRVDKEIAEDAVAAIEKLRAFGNVTNTYPSVMMNLSANGKISHNGEVRVEEATLKDMSAKNVGFTITAGSAVLGFDNKSVSGFASGGDLIINVMEVDNKSLSPDMAKIFAGYKVIKVTATLNGENVTKLAGKMALSTLVKSASKDPRVQMIMVNMAGNTEPLNASYNAKESTVSTDVSFMALYGVHMINSDGEVIVNDNTIWWIILLAFIGTSFFMLWILNERKHRM